MLFLKHYQETLTQLLPVLGFTFLLLFIILFFPKQMWLRPAGLDLENLHSLFLNQKKGVCETCLTPELVINTRQNQQA